MVADTFKEERAYENISGILEALGFYEHYDNAVTGAPNRLEFDQGFFVKLGDGAAGIKPIAHLHKTQVYQLAEN